MIPGLLVTSWTSVGVSMWSSPGEEYNHVGDLNHGALGLVVSRQRHSPRGWDSCLVLTGEGRLGWCSTAALKEIK